MFSAHEKELTEVINKLPSIEKYSFDKFPQMGSDFIFITVLGFEERCLSLPEKLAESGRHKAKKALYFQYSTNQEDNDVNKPRLLNALSKIAEDVESLICDAPDFSNNFRTKLSAYRVDVAIMNVVFDISVCSSMPLLLALKILLEADINLHILYSEAITYHPTIDEWHNNKEEHIKEDGFGIAKGVGSVLPSPEHPGQRRDNLPELIFAFPTFKPERTRAIIYHVDPSLAINPKKGVVWFIGKPHLPDNHWRMDAVKEINRVNEEMAHYFVSTFDYKDTLIQLEKAWMENNEKYHMTISPLGSKLQAIGIALFWQNHQEISIVFAIPKKYNARQYSEGCLDKWYIPLGSTKEVAQLIESIGDIEIVKNHNM